MQRNKAYTGIKGACMAARFMGLAPMDINVAAFEKTATGYIISQPSLSTDFVFTVSMHVMYSPWAVNLVG
jgi:hypothetical protein